MHVDFLIIGQGLAGSLLALYLNKKKQLVVIVDDATINSASLVAAGIINPVTGKRLVKSWQVDACLPAAKQCYLALEQQFKNPIFHSLPIYRLFQNEQEIELWQLRSSETGYADYLGDRLPPQGSSGIESSLGGFLIKGSGYINTALLLQQLREHYATHNQYIDASFHYDDMQIKPAAVQWRDIEANTVVFCEGFAATQNPWFSWLPMQPVQGEILTLKVSGSLPDKIISAGKWLLPIGNNQMKVGATYQWRPLDQKPTSQGRAQLLRAFQHLLPELTVVDVLQHSVGVRPASLDKNP
ncbi:NAD(P)/FAD-dependent oxidoreductase [Kaarinaea lacus]